MEKIDTGRLDSIASELHRISKQIMAFEKAYSLDENIPDSMDYDLLYTRTELEQAMEAIKFQARNLESFHSKICKKD